MAGQPIKIWILLLSLATSPLFAAGAESEGQDRIPVPTFRKFSKDSPISPRKNVPAESGDRVPTLLSPDRSAGPHSPVKAGFRGSPLRAQAPMSPRSTRSATGSPKRAQSPSQRRVQFQRPQRDRSGPYIWGKELTVLFCSDFYYQANGRDYHTEDLFLSQQFRLKGFKVILIHIEELADAASRSDRGAKSVIDSVDIVFLRNTGSRASHNHLLEVLRRAKSLKGKLYNDINGRGDTKGNLHLLHLYKAGFPVIPSVQLQTVLDSATETPMQKLPESLAQIWSTEPESVQSESFLTGLKNAYGILMWILRILPVPMNPNLLQLPRSKCLVLKPIDSCDSHGLITDVTVKQVQHLRSRMASGTSCEPGERATIWSQFLMNHQREPQSSSEFSEDYVVQEKVDFEHEISFYFIDKRFQYALYAPNRHKRWKLEVYGEKQGLCQADLDFAQKFVDWNCRSKSSDDLPGGCERGIQRVDACRCVDGKLLLVEIQDYNPFLSMDLLGPETQDRFISVLVASFLDFVGSAPMPS